MGNSLRQKPVVLLFVNFYLPGCKGGGPIRAIENLVSYLSNQFDFYIVTSDRDAGDQQPYPGVSINSWQRVSGAFVYYCSIEQCTVSNISNIMRDTPHDILYLSSFFNPLFVFKPLIARFIVRASNKPMVLAPKGELSLAALKTKFLKKRLYMYLLSIWGVNKKIIWHASNHQELEDIKHRILVDETVIYFAPDLVALPREPISQENIQKQAESKLRVIFLSRIVPVKNLSFALDILKRVCSDVVFHIYGPLEDMGYWKECQSLIALLPDNIQVKYCGVVNHNEIHETFLRYDVFLFPTLGESCGHVIAEALSVGTPVILSDRTPWVQLEKDQFGWLLSLDNPDGFVDSIEKCAAMSWSERQSWRYSIQHEIVNRGEDFDAIEANRQLFLSQL